MDHSITNTPITPRQSEILDLLSKFNNIRISELKQRFNVSEVTLRSDLAQLENLGLVNKYHGGVCIPELERPEIPFTNRLVENKKQKIKIGKKAASLIENGDIVILDSGTTVTQLAANLKEKMGVTIITNCLNVAHALKTNPNLTVHLTGGMLDFATFSLAGPEAERSLNEIHADKLFLATHAIDDGVLMERNMLIAQVKRAMIQNAAETILLADSFKFGKKSFTSVTSLNQINTVITDSDLKDEYKNQLLELGIKLILV